MRPTPLEQLTANPEYQGGVWLLVDIDLAKLKVKAKRVNIRASFKSVCRDLNKVVIVA